MDTLDFKTWIKKVSLQSSLKESEESGESEAYDTEAWLMQGKLVPVDSSTFKASSYEELKTTGAIT